MANAEWINMKLLEISTYRDGGSIGMLLTPKVSYFLYFGIANEMIQGRLYKGNINKDSVLASAVEMREVLEAIADYDLDHTHKDVQYTAYAALKAIKFISMATRHLLSPVDQRLLHMVEVAKSEEGEGNMIVPWFVHEWVSSKEKEVR